MATDLGLVCENLRACYDLRDRTLLVVGAGGGQFVDVYRDARHVVAVDSDASAMARLETALRERPFGDRFELLVRDFEACDRSVDTVVFEFCLHEIPDPARALAHARTLAPDVLVFDHAPGSPWSWQACEEAKVVASWEAVERVGMRSRRDFSGEQVFRGRAELEARLAEQGPLAIERAAKFPVDAVIRIPMDYRCALV